MTETRVSGRDLEPERERPVRLQVVAGPCNDRNRTDRDHRRGMIPPADFEAIY